VQQSAVFEPWHGLQLELPSKEEELGALMSLAQQKKAIGWAAHGVGHRIQHMKIGVDVDVADADAEAGDLVEQWGGRIRWGY
jgi:hypothetical protein